MAITQTGSAVDYQQSYADIQNALSDVEGELNQAVTDAQNGTENLGDVTKLGTIEKILTAILTNEKTQESDFVQAAKSA